jgi:hypothetical protein
MARVGEAHIVVRAITTGVANDIKRGLRGASGSVDAAGRRSGESLGNAFSRGFNSGGKNVFSRLADGLRSAVPDARALSMQFRSLTRISMSVGTVVSVLIGAIGTLVGGIGALIGALGAATPAVMGLVGAFVTLGIASRAARFAMGGIGAAVSQATKANGALGKSIKQVREELQQLAFDAKDAELSEREAALNVEKARNNLLRMQDLPPNSIARREAQLQYEQAEASYRRAKDRAADLREQLANGVVDPNALGGNDPFAGLTKSQKAFAQFLVTLSPKIDELKEALAKGFLPILQEQIERLIKEFDGKLIPVFERLGVALGNASKEFTDAFITGGGPDKLITVIDNALPNIEKFGTILGQIFETFLDLLIAAQPITNKFIDFIARGIKNFSDYIDELTESGELVTFFETAGEMMGLFGKIFGNIFGGLGAIISANFGEGSGGYVLLEYLRDVTASFASLDGDAAGAGSLRQYFIDVVENLKPLLGFLGDLTKIILDLGAEPAIGETFKVMREGLPNLQAILQKLIEAGPNMAELGNSLGRLLNALTDSEAPQVFFDTLNFAVKALADFFENETVKAITDVIARVFAFVSAVALIGSQAIFFGKVFVGVFASIFSRIGAVIGVFKGIGTVLTLIMKNGIIKGLLIWLRSVVAFGGPIAAMFAKLAMFLGKVLFGAFALVKAIVISIGTAIKAAFIASPIGVIIAAIALVTAGLVWFFTQTEIGKKLWENFTKFLQEAFASIGKWFADLGAGIGNAWNATVAFVGNIWSGFVGFFRDAIKNIGNFFKDVFTGIGDFFKTVINGWIGLVEGFVNFFIRGINNIINAINTLKFQAPDWVPLIGGQKVGFNLPLVPTISLPRLAEGGTVFPSAGGSLVNVAEAGRPERIEPLDSDGLSQRDRAMIQMLSGGGGATINVYPSAGMDETEIANIVSRKLAFQLRKGGF